MTAPERGGAYIAPLVMVANVAEVAGDAHRLEAHQHGEGDEAAHDERPTRTAKTAANVTRGTLERRGQG